MLEIYIINQIIKEICKKEYQLFMFINNTGCGYISKGIKSKHQKNLPIGVNRFHNRQR